MYNVCVIRYGLRETCMLRKLPSPLLQLLSFSALLAPLTATFSTCACTALDHHRASAAAFHLIIVLKLATIYICVQSLARTPFIISRTFSSVADMSRCSADDFVNVSCKIVQICDSSLAIVSLVVHL